MRATQLPRPQAFPKLVDEESILSLGQIRSEGNLSYLGKLFCKNTNVQAMPRMREIGQTPSGFTINDALAKPAKATELNNQAQSGDYVAKDLNQLIGRPKISALRIFLVDAPERREFHVSNTTPASFKQLQVWYNGVPKNHTAKRLWLHLCTTCGSRNPIQFHIYWSYRGQKNRMCRE